MSLGDDVWIKLVAFAAVLGGLLIVVATLHRRSTIRTLGDSRGMTTQYARVRSEDAPIISPLRGVSFQEFLDVVKFDDTVDQRAVGQVNTILGNARGLMLKTSVDQLRRVAKAGVNYEFNPEIQKMLTDGTAKRTMERVSGKLMAIARRSKGPGGGRFVGQAKETFTRNPAKLVGAIDPVAAIVLLAHMVSNADNARALAELGGKLDILTAHRRIDQYAALERIFYETRQLLEEETRPEPHYDRVSKSRELRFELLELRSVWRQEAARELNELRNPAEASWLSRNTTIDSRIDGRLVPKLRAAARNILDIAYTMRLDAMLAGAFPDMHGESDMVQHQLRELHGLCDLFRERAAFIKDAEQRALWLDFTQVSKSRMLALTDTEPVNRTGEIA